MTINVTQQITAYNGQPLVKEDNVKEAKTFRSEASIALNNFMPGEKPATPQEKESYFQLTNKLYSADVVDFTIEELATIKKRVGIVHNPLIMGRLNAILESAQPEKPIDNTPKHEA